MFLGRERRRPGVLGSVFRMVDRAGMRADAKAALDELGIGTLQDITQAVETLSGGQRQAVAVARAAAFGSKVVILDEPTAALGVKESGQVLQLIRDLRDRGLPVILISHNMPHVFEVADRIHIQRLGSRIAVVTPESHTPSEAVAIMTGAAVG
jgi:fructose transport system ATP-binding protein